MLALSRATVSQPLLIPVAKIQYGKSPVCHRSGVCQGRLNPIVVQGGATCSVARKPFRVVFGVVLGGRRLAQTPGHDFTAHAVFKQVVL
eukprot:12639469-Alexandrium_andersonii.AAC.1